jgi:hypothetical protein
MPWVSIAPIHVSQDVKTQTREGEITINLNLTLNIRSDGSVEVSANQNNNPIPSLPKPKPPGQTYVSKPEKTNFMLPILEPVRPEDFLDFNN